MLVGAMANNRGRMWLVLACALAARGTNAQERAEAQAQPTFVRVETAAGAPLGNAVVTFAGCVPHAGDAGPNDVQHVQSDERGRARARLQPALCYVAWAVGPADAQGRCAVSQARGWFGGGALMTLRCDEPQAPRRIRVTGADAWAALGPLQFVALTSPPMVELPLPLGDDGDVVLPPGPHDVIEVRTATGQPLWHLSPLKDVLALPPPQGLRVRAVDEKGAPVAGAVVRHRVGRLRAWRVDTIGGVVTDRWRVAGTTDNDGRCTVDVPYPAHPLTVQTYGELALFVSAGTGPATAGGVFNRGVFVDDMKLDNARSEELQFTCRKSDPLIGRINGLPPGAIAQLVATCKLMVSGNSYSHDARSFQAPVAADGTFVFGDVPHDIHASRLTFVFPGDSRLPPPRFPARSGRELPPEVTVEGGALLGDAFATLRVAVTDHGGGPARGLVAILVPVPHAVPNPNAVPARDVATRMPLDTRGAASLLLTPGQWVVMLASDAGFCVKSLDVLPGEHDVALAMQPLPTMRVELRDAAGQPVAGARVVVRNTTSRGSNDPTQNILSQLRSQSRAEWNSLRTDAEGRITLAFVPLETMTQRLALTWDGGGSSTEFALEPNDDWLVVRPK